MTVALQPAPCAIAPRDKRAQAKRVGSDLVRHHGKRKFYAVSQVRAANERCGIQLDVACWSHAMFNTHADFDRMHGALGEACDYVAMKQQMLEAVAMEGAPGWLNFDFDLSWIEFPDLDGSIFDLFD